MNTAKTWIVALGAVLVLVATSSTTRARGAKVGRAAPDFTHTDLAGVEHRLSDHDGDVRLVYF